MSKKKHSVYSLIRQSFFILSKISTILMILVMLKGLSIHEAVIIPVFVVKRTITPMKKRRKQKSNPKFKLKRSFICRILKYIKSLF